jgi:hypothetical protein
VALLSNANSIHDAAVATIQGLGLTLGTPPVAVNVVKRKVGTIEPAVAATPTISVSCSRQEGTSKLWDTGGNTRKWWEYLVEIDMSAAGNRDPTGGLPDYQSWRQVISRAFGDVLQTYQVLLTGTDQLYDILIEPGPVIDRADYRILYDESKMTLKFVTIESTS